MTAALNDLEVKLDNILNANVQASVIEKVWNMLDLEFGKDTRKTAVIVRALCCITLVGAAFRSHHAKHLESLGNQFCKANPDLWLNPEIRPEELVKY